MVDILCNNENYENFTINRFAIDYEGKKNWVTMSRSISDLILDLIPSYIEFFFQLIYLTLKSLYSEDGVFIRKKEDKTRFVFFS